MSRIVIPFVVALVGCQRDRPPPAPVEPAGSTTKNVDPSKALGPLVDRLHYEATHRPAAALPAELVLDELAQVDLGVVARRQYVGAQLLASYCLGGTTKDGVAISICEYADNPRAVAGKAFMDRQFGAMQPAAHRVVRDTTVLSIVDPGGATSPLTSRALQRFAAISPRVTEPRR